MNPFDEQRRRDRAGSLRVTLMLIGFGVAVLGYLVAIDRTTWFQDVAARPVVVAMSSTSANEAESAMHLSVQRKGRSHD